MAAATPSQHASYLGQNANPDNRGYGTASAVNAPSRNLNYPDYPAQQLGAPTDDQTYYNTHANAQRIASPDGVDHLAVPNYRPTKFTEEWDASRRGSSILEGPTSNMQRSNSVASQHSHAPSQSGGESTLSRGNTLKKKASLRRGGSLSRRNSRRSMKAGSVRSLALQSSVDGDDLLSAFSCPVPTSGNPTEALANRFQTWRKILKDLITYFREIQNHYEHRAKSLVKLANVLNNISTPPGFLASGGLDDALQILRNHNKQSVVEANKAREIEEDVILALTGLRSDLQQKIKEIKSLSGDFKNSVDKEMDATRRAVNHLQDCLGQTELDSALTTGKQDPYLLRLAVDRQLERQIEEENYLHQAYLNIENSGRELEGIVVGEIQKSYNAYAGILKREADNAYNSIDELRVGPIAMPKDHEWLSFVQSDAQFVDPDIAIRSAHIIHYPGKDHYACQEIRAGLLERKSKYLKSYTAGWYVLSPTHLHEFKSADKTQAPIMSLFLPEQKLGSHSSEGGSSNKFILKGRQTGAMHRGHTWVFRAESHDTMMAWYEDIRSLTEKTPQERTDFVRGHSRSFSRSSQRSISSDGLVNEQDDEPFAPDAASISQTSKQESLQRRPEPGGRFPSDIQVNAQRGLQAPLSPSSVSSGLRGNSDRDVIAAAEGLPGSAMEGMRHEQFGYGDTAARTQQPEQRQPTLAGTNQSGTGGYDGGYDGGYGRRSNYENDPSLAPTGAYAGAAGAGSSRFSWQEPDNAGAPPARNVPPYQNEYADRHTATFADMTNGAYGAPSHQYAPQDGPIPVQEDQAVAAPVPGDISLAGINLNNSQSHGRTFSPDDTNSSILSVSTQQTEESKALRPNAGARTESVPTISNLHIPGEYPKNSPKRDASGKQ